jgi:hypothetical protein
MRAEELNKYIHQPHLLKEEDIPALKKLVEDFPYFQSAHLLLTLAGRKWDAAVYQQSLRKTAIVSTNRSQLYKLIQKFDNIHDKALSSEKSVNTEGEQIEKENASSAVTKEEITEIVKNELNILKAAENSAAEDQGRNEGAKETSEIVQSQKEEIVKTPAPFEEQINKEFSNAVVNAFVEKEILKTNELLKSNDRPEPESFAGWLQFLKKNNGQSYAKIEEEVNKGMAKTAEKKLEKATPKHASEKNTKEKKKAIIDKIIETNPGIIRQKEQQKFFKSDFKARESLVENEHLVTETLAKIYALQGNVGKAIRAYEILSLKFPQKSAYFATLIEKLKNNQ